MVNCDPSITALNVLNEHLVEGHAAVNSSIHLSEKANNSKDGVGHSSGSASSINSLPLSGEGLQP